jgi:hypothetical protein
LVTAVAFETGFTVADFRGATFGCWLCCFELFFDFLPSSDEDAEASEEALWLRDRVEAPDLRAALAFSSAEDRDPDRDERLLRREACNSRFKSEGNQVRFGEKQHGTPGNSTDSNKFRHR